MEERQTSRIQDRLIHALRSLRSGAIELEKARKNDIELIEADYRDSARNLIHYLSVRSRDLRYLQHDLSSLGLSSIGRLEAHTMASLNAVLETLLRLAGLDVAEAEAARPPVSFRSGPMLLEDHTRELLGRQSGRRGVRIMVTMPSEAATTPDLVQRLLEAGMDVMRINCAHDDPSAWLAMIANLRAAERRTGRHCQVLADLSGPKLRTGSLSTEPGVMKIRPRRDHRGSVVVPARIWLTPARAPEPPPFGVDAELGIEGDVLEAAQPGDRLRVEDARGRKRRVRIDEVHGTSLLGSLRRTLYVPDGGTVRIKGRRGPTGRVAGLAAMALPIVLHTGDSLILTRADTPGRGPIRDGANRVVEAARISCSLPEVFGAAAPGDPIWFDDGKIGGVVRSNDGDEISVEITQARPKGSRLRADKGVNLPATDIDVAALTPRDLENLATLAGKIDMVGLSFVRHPADVIELEDRLHELGAGHLGIVLKIENQVAFENLPSLLLAGLRSPPIGVMVARGDLAVEVGFARLSEIQEQILWICEAAHVPVIWATQVLEDMAKSGMPTRAEVTDAAMSGRADCVMLNKGPYIVEAVEFLSGVLERMESHQSKKSAMLRRLSIADLT